MKLLVFNLVSALAPALVLSLGCGGRGDSTSGGGVSPKAPSSREADLPPTVREALRLFDTAGREVTASKDPDLFIVIFEHHIKRFPPLSRLRSFPAEERLRIACLLNGYALAIQRKDRFKEAEEFFKNVMKLAPELRAPYFNLGILLCQTGRFKESREIFEMLGKEDLTADQKEKNRFWLDKIREIRGATGR